MEKKSALEKQLFQLENKLLVPEIRTSKEELTNLLADNFFEFGSSGKVLYKDEEISEATLGIVQMTMSDFEIHLLSEEIVLATYRIYNEVNKQHSLRVRFGNLSMDSGRCIFIREQKFLDSFHALFFLKNSAYFLLSYFSFDNFINNVYIC